MTLTVIPAGPIDRVFEGVAVPTTPRGGLLGWGMCRTTTPTLSDRQAAPVPLDSSGNIKVAQGVTPVGAYTWLAINFAGAGDNTIIAGVGGQRIRIAHFNFVLGNVSAITIKDGATSKSGAYPLQQFMGLVFDAPGGGATLDCATGNAFVINSGSAVQVSGFVLYTQS